MRLLYMAPAILSTRASVCAITPRNAPVEILQDVYIHLCVSMVIQKLSARCPLLKYRGHYDRHLSGTCPYPTNKANDFKDTLHYEDIVHIWNSK